MQHYGKIKNAAKYAGVSAGSIRKWIEQGLTCYRVGGLVLIKFTDIDTFIEQHDNPLNDEDRQELNSILNDMGLTDENERATDERSNRSTL